MLNLELHRYGFGRDSTLGRLSLRWKPAAMQRAKTFSCFTLEDERRRKKVKGETCIPPGTYEIKLRTEGGMHDRYLEKFGSYFHKGMLWLQDVPDFTYVYIHIGNRERDTDGCPLVGQVPVALPDGEFEVARSTDAYRTLYKIVLAAFEAGERVAIHITEDERK